MANVSYGPIVDDIRGSIGGTTFSRAHSGSTARSRPRPPRPTSASQRMSQQLITQAQGSWSTLTTLQKSAWTTYASSIDLVNSLGKTYHPTGLQAFIWLWITQTLMLIYPVILTPPTLPGLPITPTITFIILTHGLWCNSITPTMAANEHMILYIPTPAKVHVFSRAPILNRSSFSTPPVFPFILALNYDNSFASGQILGAQIAWRYRDQYLRCSILHHTQFIWTVT